MLTILCFVLGMGMSVIVCTVIIAINRKFKLIFHTDSFNAPNSPQPLRGLEYFFNGPCHP